MARDDNPSYTQALSDRIDAAYEAYKASQPAAERQLHAALMAQAKNVLSFRIGPHDPSLGSDITHRALLAVSKFTGKSKFSTWFYRIAQNEANRELRKLSVNRKTFVSLEADLERETASDNEPAVPPVDLTAELSVVTLREGLPREQAEVLDLNAQGNSLEAIAKMLNKPLGTIRSRYRLAKQKMKRKASK